MERPSPLILRQTPMNHVPFAGAGVPVSEVLIVVLVLFVVPFVLVSSPQPTITPKLNSKANANNFFIFSSSKSRVSIFPTEPLRGYILDTGI